MKEIEKLTLDYCKLEKESEKCTDDVRLANIFLEIEYINFRIDEILEMGKCDNICKIN